jgi:hypothetical protein
MHAAFFSEDAMDRIGLMDGIDNGSLSQPIHLRDVVVVGLGADLQSLRPFQVSHDDISSLAGGPDRDIKHRVHSLSLKYDKRGTL